MAAHRVVRATADVDFLVAATDVDRVRDLLLSLGYHCVHRSTDAANYARCDEGIDLLYAHRPIALRLLNQAATRDTPFGRLRVISAEGLIGFKLQALCNNPSRGRDLDDIRQLLRSSRKQLDLLEVSTSHCSSGRNNSMSCLPGGTEAASPQPICGDVPVSAAAAVGWGFGCDCGEARFAAMRMVRTILRSQRVRKLYSDPVFRIRKRHEISG